MSFFASFRPFNLQYNHTIYQEWGYYYDVYFNLYLDEQKTNEEVRIWVNSEGDVISYSNFMVNCFDDATTDSITDQSVAEAKNESEELVYEELEGNDYKIDDQYLTYDEDGELAIETVYTYFVTDGMNNIKCSDSVIVPIQE